MPAEPTPQVVALARVLCQEATGENPDSHNVHDRPLWHAWIPEARTAIAHVLDALAEPSEAMIEAAIDAYDDECRDGFDKYHARVINTAMLAVRRRELTAPR